MSAGWSSGHTFSHAEQATREVFFNAQAIGIQKSYSPSIFFIYFRNRCTKRMSGNGPKRQERAGWAEVVRTPVRHCPTQTSPPPTTTTDTNALTLKIAHDVDRHRPLQTACIRFRSLPHPQTHHREQPNRTILLPRRRLLFRPRIVLSMGHDCRRGHVAGRAQARYQLGGC